VKWSGLYLLMLSNGRWLLAMGSATFIINGVNNTKNDKCEDKPSGNKSDNGSGDSHDYLFIPRVASEPLEDSF
jgi:hypothetical protein